MSFMDELRKLTQPYEDEDDFYEGAESLLRKRQKTPLRQPRMAEEKGSSPAWEERKRRGRGLPPGNGRWNSAERNSR